MSLERTAISMGLGDVTKFLQREACRISLAEHAYLVTLKKTPAVQAVSWNWKIERWLEGLFSKSRKMHWEWIICLDTEGWVSENGLSRRQVELKPKTQGNDCSEGQLPAKHWHSLYAPSYSQVQSFSDGPPVRIPGAAHPGKSRKMTACCPLHFWWHPEVNFCPKSPIN